MSGSSSHIFVLEDNPADLYMIKYSIRQAGVACEFTAFADGAEAMKFVKADASPVPDLMILDGNVPGIEGAAVLDTVRSNRRWLRVGVFMFTGSRNPEDVALAGKLGADRYLLKPMDVAGFERIGQIVRAWLEGKSYEKTR